MNGKLVSGKPLYVAVAQRKDERRARLQVLPLPLSLSQPFLIIHFVIPYNNLSVMKCSDLLKGISYFLELMNLISRVVLTTVLCN